MGGDLIMMMRMMMMMMVTTMALIVMRSDLVATGELAITETAVAAPEVAGDPWHLVVGVLAEGEKVSWRKTN